MATSTVFSVTTWRPISRCPTPPRGAGWNLVLATVPLPGIGPIRAPHPDGQFGAIHPRGGLGTQVGDLSGCNMDVYCRRMEHEDSEGPRTGSTLDVVEFRHATPNGKIQKGPRTGK
jgi:hypothetical protein